MERPIVTSHVYPPIPVRDFDWCAYFDDVGADCAHTAGDEPRPRPSKTFWTITGRTRDV